VIAETLADGVASIGVLKKCGFVRAGEPAAEPGAVRWELFLTP
jgi:RimJ/RimL family protein N-acetyltransferase